MKLIIYIVLFFTAYYVYSNANENSNSDVSARELYSQCDIVLFTTASCPYCKKARSLLISKGKRWCERDINISAEYHKVFKSLGGKGVPLAVIGDKLIKGYREDQYIAALDQL